MRSDGEIAFCSGGIFGVIIAAVVFIWFIAPPYAESWKEWAIKAGVAEYNRETGQWQQKPFDCQCPKVAAE